MRLSDIKIKNAKPKEKSYKAFDGGGLYIEIMPTNKKLWRLKYYFLGKEKRFSLGAYPIVSLAEAREARDDAKRLIHKGIDPSQAKKDKKIAATRNAENTFKSVALEWLDVRGKDWSKGYRDKLIQGLEGNIFPYIGDRPIMDITPILLLDTLRKVEGRGAYDIAQRTKSICSRIFQYGISIGKCEWDAAQNLKGALKSHKTEHFRTLELKALPDFLRALERNEARIYERTRRAVYLSLYTFCRPQEIRMAKWEHIDFDNALWTIPAELMKMRKDHIVPLSSQVIEVLQAQKEELEGINTEWVFPSQVRLRNSMSDGTVNKAIKRLGFGKDMVAHGFRALARTTIAEQLHYSAEVIEKQLAHKTNNPLGEAYDRTQFLDQRKEMMQAWADYLEGV
jgi:integrase